MSQRKKKKRSYLDKDDFLSDYCQRFIKPRSLSTTTQTESRETYHTESTETLSGKEAKEFYDSLTQTESHHINASARVKSVPNRRKSYAYLDLQDRNTVKKYIGKLFSLCGRVEDIGELLQHIRIAERNPGFVDVLNASDQYGWTAIMCATAADNIEAMKILVGKGASYMHVYDKGGNGLFDICKKNGSYRVEEYLYTLKRNTDTLASKEPEPPPDPVVTCELCGVSYKSSKKKAHEASTIHLFKDNSKLGPHNLYGIPQSNVGFQMMLRSGWTKDSGLGPEGSGRKNPIKTTLKQDRAGFGLNQQSQRVSHFNAFDSKAVAPPERKKKKKFHSDMTDKLKNTSREKLKSKMWERDLRRYMTY